MSAVEIHNITKQFGDVCALNNVTVSFGENKIYGLLGKNGAGKSTLLNIITNRLFADAGEVLVDGENAAEADTAQRKLYLINEQKLFPEKMTATKAFYWTKQFYPDFDIEYAKKLAELFDLPLNKEIRSLSTGFATIFKIVIALSVNTPYLFLDEPVLGLDANYRELFYKLLLQKYAEKPCTIVISTHIIEEISALLEEVVIIKDGEVIRSESRESLLSGSYCVTGSISAVDAYCADKTVIGSDTIGGLKTAYLSGKPESELPANLELSSMNLQKLFIQLTNA